MERSLQLQTRKKLWHLLATFIRLKLYHKLLLSLSLEAFTKKSFIRVFIDSLCLNSCLDSFAYVLCFGWEINNNGIWRTEWKRNWWTRTQNVTLRRECSVYKWVLKSHHVLFFTLVEKKLQRNDTIWFRGKNMRLMKIILYLFRINCVGNGNFFCYPEKGQVNSFLNFRFSVKMRFLTFNYPRRRRQQETWNGIESSHGLCPRRVLPMGIWQHLGRTRFGCLRRGHCSDIQLQIGNSRYVEKVLTFPRGSLL